MMNASRPLVTPEELQCLLGWPLAEVHDEHKAKPDSLAMPGWPAHALAPASPTPAAGFPHRA